MRSSREVVSRCLRALAPLVAGTACAALLLAGSPLCAAPVIDRVLAVVSGAIITLSDVEAAIAFGVVNTAGAVDPVRSALDQSIDRSLMLIEVDRYAPPEPPSAEVDARVRALEARAGSPAQLKKTLDAVGFSEARLRLIARDDLRLQTYLTQRFAGTLPATDEEVQQYYREHQNEFVRDGTPLPLAAVEPEVRARLDAARRASLVADWLRQLRLRADILIVPR